ncbi:hypothetical protein GJ744_005975 [Endocarpon pusillum]|uniref:Uncharacterized protein n=1 Tax=Endocarpon pusillum TaxID=364733 RepID=A0A8H7A830_9EURO|nr:hypothetical protein GJ744_005975 [Endocarpon pusillum]
MPHKELFKIHNIAERTGYKILKQGTTRRGPGVHNRGRNHYRVAKTIGMATGSERAIQRNMADFSVGTYRALQKK